MATIDPTVIATGRGDGSTLRVIWTPVTAADTCRAVSYPECADKSIQVAGTFDSASVAVNGSNDGTNFAALRDPGGTTIAITSAAIRAILENTVVVVPLVSGGGGSQSLTISMLIHLTNPLRT